MLKGHVWFLGLLSDEETACVNMSVVRWDVGMMLLMSWEFDLA
jgi:hypothetical protein